jgi:hypothetical protein
MSATKELLERRGADYVAALVDHADEMIERLERTNAELLELLQGVLGAHRVHEVILTAGYERRIVAAITRAKGGAE